VAHLGWQALRWFNKASTSILFCFMCLKEIDEALGFIK
jgi:hypothetical protein